MERSHHGSQGDWRQGDSGSEEAQMGSTPNLNSSLESTGISLKLAHWVPGHEGTGLCGL